MSLWPSSPKLADGTVVSIGGAPVRLKVNARARRISLRIDAARGEGVATAPTLRRLGDALRFAQSRAGWLAAHLDRLPPALSLAPGALLEADGAPLRLDRAAMRIKAHLIAATDAEPARLIVFGDGEAYARAATRALRALALQRLTVRTDHHARALGLPAPQITVMDARTRWGSCRQGGNGQPARIRYNWRLILAPAWVLDYVAAHEAAHLMEANHSPAYWAVVKGLYGDHRPARAWLRAHGAALHAVGG